MNAVSWDLDSARTAPLRPVIDQHRRRGLQDFRFKRCIGHVVNMLTHGTCLRELMECATGDVAETYGTYANQISPLCKGALPSSGPPRHLLKYGLFSVLQAWANPKRLL